MGPQQEPVRYRAVPDTGRSAFPSGKILFKVLCVLLANLNTQAFKNLE